MGSFSGDLVANDRTAGARASSTPIVHLARLVRLEYATPAT